MKLALGLEKIEKPCCNRNKRMLGAAGKMETFTIIIPTYAIF
jgi:hypothetical protein